MPKHLKQQCRKLVVLGYLVVQGIVGLAVRTIGLHYPAHLALLSLASIAYLAIALKNPGYVEYIPEPCRAEASKQTKQNKGDSAEGSKKKAKSSQLVKNLSVIKEEKEQEICELGINSLIKVEARKAGVTKPIEAIPQLVPAQLNACIMQGQIEPSGFVALPGSLRAIKRHCQVCKGDQPLRARHCLDCNKCVRAFDHHCPWINNCIGQKNKVNLIFFLLMQLVQLFGLSVDLLVNIERGVTRQSLSLWLAVTALGIALLGVFVFQVYLVVINLTTWECLRWYRIEYLQIFSKEKLVSLFDRGVCQNLATFWKGGCSREPVNWLQHLNYKAHECLNTAKGTTTERRLNNDSPL